jgi:hypothetical protein
MVVRSRVARLRQRSVQYRCLSLSGTWQIGHIGSTVEAAATLLRIGKESQPAVDDDPDPSEPLGPEIGEILDQPARRVVAQREAEGRASVVLVFSHQDVNSALGQAEPGPPSASAHPPNVASEGRALLDRAIALQGRGPYVLQAAIASVQTEDPIDWSEVAALYAELARLTGSTVVELNRAVAVAEVEGPAAALEIVDSLALDDYQYLHSTRADLLRRLERTEEARLAYERALELTRDETERRFLEGRIREL